MKTTAFEASLELPSRGSGRDIRGFIILNGEEIAVSARFIPGSGERSLARIETGRPVEIRWREPFEFRSGDGRLTGLGFVLLPGPPDPKKLKGSKRKALLERLSGGEKEMILALVEERGIQGLRAVEIDDFSGLDKSRIEGLARELEEADAIRILSFSPLFLISQRALDFLRERVLEFLARFHARHPDEKGPTRAKIGARFGPPEKVLALILRALEKSGRLKSEGDLVWLADFRIPLRPEDEDVLARLETILYRGEFAAASLEDIRRELRLNEKRLQALLSVLLERNKIVKGKDGFLIHSLWLDDIVKTIRESGKRELTIADFKEISGLSRKYAIPLLEFLDEMGVTRRKGSVREIL